MCLNLFYGEPDPDRWFKFDRYPRRIIRRLLRGPKRPSGQKMVIINLMKGLDRLEIPYRINDYHHIRKHPEELACIIGKPFVLYERAWKNPVLFGASIFSHPIDCLNLFERYPVKKLLVPGNWMKSMFEPYYGNKVHVWPVGIDTEYWSPNDDILPQYDFLVYQKILWPKTGVIDNVVNPIIDFLKQNNFRFQIIQYGSYFPEDLRSKVLKSRAAIFLCEHETQGIAYQQILAMDKPIFAWDRNGYWIDPSYYPHRVQFNEGVTSVPYWDDRCGMKFSDDRDFAAKLPLFLEHLNEFQPRAYILENLTLEISARKYVEIARSIK